MAHLKPLKHLTRDQIHELPNSNKVSLVINMQERETKLFNRIAKLEARPSKIEDSKNNKLTDKFRTHISPFICRKVSDITPDNVFARNQTMSSRVDRLLGRLKEVTDYVKLSKDASLTEIMNEMRKLTKSTEQADRLSNKTFERLNNITSVIPVDRGNELEGRIRIVLTRLEAVSKALSLDSNVTVGEYERAINDLKGAGIFPQKDIKRLAEVCSRLDVTDGRSYLRRVLFRLQSVTEILGIPENSNRGEYVGAIVKLLDRKDENPKADNRLTPRAIERINETVGIHAGMDYKNRTFSDKVIMMAGRLNSIAKALDVKGHDDFRQYKEAIDILKHKSVGLPSDPAPEATLAYVGLLEKVANLYFQEKDGSL